jgi:hypothetical protein
MLRSFAKGDRRRAVHIIPVIDIGSNSLALLAERERARALALVDATRRQFTPVALRLLDGPSRRWLARTGNPYRQEIDRIAGIVGRPGVHALNLSFEWACSCATAPDPAGGQQLWRTLDWPLHGIGTHLVVARQMSAAGPWLNVTWPGFCGALTILAPGRFAAAINLPPLRRRSGLLPLDWLLMRRDVGRSRGLPCSHLLRQAAEQAPDYAAARRMLTETELCTPAIFTLCGLQPGEGCVIERMETSAICHDGRAAVSNHWLTPALGPGDRGIESGQRLSDMRALAAASPAGPPFHWVRPPVLNRFTRLAVEANPATGRLAVRGYERDGPATEILELPAG